ncbi:APC family permease [Galactobacter caseinivorans]|uniref:Amino acid permease n=1 Tax=Galactobacter caseinivorans TaxID=2676123 RepID=A0A496PIK1_9MICC|nr:amino acid permease [Galactobacter caseinivorans]RKW70322.1 amino acid permease [Galactobacter caseinivorans]
MSVMRRKSVEAALASTEDEERNLKRTLTAWDLALMGVAVAVGAGIFSVGAKAAATKAGPAVIISFIIAAIVCGLAIMCYAEFAATIPVAGSAYTFSYTSMGEMVAWIIGWDLILEMMLAAAVIASYWGVYLAVVFDVFNLQISTTILGKFDGLHFDWAPLFIVAAFTALLVAGTKMSARVGNVFTLIKLGITLFVIVAGFFYIKAENYSPFIPPAEAAESTSVLHTTLFAFLTGQAPTMYGVFGVLGGAALVFFAFIGFDVVATTAEETKDPQKTLPKGILSGLVIVSVLYILVTLVVTGMVSYKDLAAQEQPSLATAFQLVGAEWAAAAISIGILVGLTTVILVLLMGATRIIFALSRDGLLPRWFSVTNAKTKTPARLQIIVGVVVALIAAIIPVGVLEEMINIGTLSAFVLVSFGIPVLRKRRPDLPRTFKVPWNPVLPIFSGIVCLWLMMNLSVETWMRFALWLVLGFIIYFAYGYRHSRLRTHPEEIGK